MLQFERDDRVGLIGATSHYETEFDFGDALDVPLRLVLTELELRFDASDDQLDNNDGP
ncbi:hypothetical protein ACIQGO_38390 [Streptomyces shenzhenensis]|uniref:hypothetical protein n=1 Tax=Streptomyces shenzhenensis TaxID=943815 RepID=UPI0037FA9561